MFFLNAIYLRLASYAYPDLTWMSAFITSENLGIHGRGHHGTT
jgi:hypothetical protein